jgi:crotonobetainyl-CoA:carnitine CoA-transferase CaiB-like acyl-CoA transferase
MKDVYADKQLNFRDYFLTIDYPGVGEFRIPSAPAKWGSGWSIRSLAPRLGQHTEEILVGELGISSAEFATLRQAEII